ncbi:hypothetical protein BX600DRAFT_440748 [Xylariales sp. PMI_506]|nr:hypothetical protein BX600DRAFT_440748 [Xylariales sp. PMI_506]
MPRLLGPVSRHRKRSEHDTTVTATTVHNTSLSSGGWEGRWWWCVVSCHDSRSGNRACSTAVLSDKSYSMHTTVCIRHQEGACNAAYTNCDSGPGGQRAEATHTKRCGLFKLPDLPGEVSVRNIGDLAEGGLPCVESFFALCIRYLCVTVASRESSEKCVRLPTGPSCSSRLLPGDVSPVWAQQPTFVWGSGDFGGDDRKGLGCDAEVEGKDMGGGVCRPEDAN